MLGIRCQGEDVWCNNCLNPNCECPNHVNDSTRAERIRQGKNRGHTRRTYRSVYHMDDPNEGDLYEFSAITND